MNKLFLVLLLAFTACTTTDNKTEETGEIILVNSTKVDCVGVAPMKCLQIKRLNQDSKDESAWEFFYSKIEGFEYQPGFIYKLKIKSEKLPKAQVPQDASSIKYTLVEVLSKEVDRRLRLTDIWNLERIDGKEIVLNQENPDRPILEINVGNMKVSGTGGCNAIMGSIKELGEEKLIFNPIASTKKLCRNMEIETQFLSALNQTHAYKIENNHLHLYNADNTETLVFRKGD